MPQSRQKPKCDNIPNKYVNKIKRLTKKKQAIFV